MGSQQSNIMNKGTWTEAELQAARDWVGQQEDGNIEGYPGRPVEASTSNLTGADVLPGNIDRVSDGNGDVTDLYRKIYGRHDGKDDSKDDSKNGGKNNWKKDLKYDDPNKRICFSLRDIIRRPNVFLRDPRLPAQILTRLPAEVTEQIHAYARSQEPDSSRLIWNRLASNGEHPAQRPPPNGACPFMEMPRELRQTFFADELVGKDVVFAPHCGREDHDDNSLAAKRNRTSDLMTINKALCEEIATILYEEREFVIHIHEGFKHGGIEFVDAGRQKLQYQQEVIEDDRFAKFKHGEDFGFDRLKKIKIIIFPAAASDEPEYRHMHINTFFMTWALCQLLQRSEESNKLKYISLEFATPVVGNELPIGRRAIAKAENYLWDPLTNKPTAASIEWLPDIEVLLRPFAILRTHNVTIALPKHLNEDPSSVDFVARLQRRMLSAHGNMGTYDTDFMDEKYAHTIRGLGGDFLRYTFDTIYGAGGGYKLEGLGSNDMCDADEEDQEEHLLDEDKQMQRVIANSLRDARESHGDSGNEEPL
ncbi:hypothetical protein LTR74_012426 [Friedmanniomyces endolithicus]|nr:hypothetical protein LTR74_012426 [Friedmanniomyces endolithicus]